MYTFLIYDFRQAGIELGFIILVIVSIVLNLLLQKYGY